MRSSPLLVVQRSALAGEQRAHQVRRVAVASGAENLSRQAAQIVHHDQAQHDRNRPQFADGQGRDRLKRFHEARDVAFVQAAVAVGDQLQSDGINARQTVERAAFDLGQPLIITVRQIGANLRQRFVDDVEVVEQPFGVAAERFLTAVSGADLPMGAEKLAAVFQEAPQQRPTRLDRRGSRLFREMTRMGFQPVRSVQFRADRLIAVRIAEQRPRRRGRRQADFRGLRMSHNVMLSHTARRIAPITPDCVGSVVRK